MVVAQTRRPLSVSTDKLGVTAMRCAHLLQRWSAGETIDRSGRGRFVEVYPAAALQRWGLKPDGYKRGGQAVLRARLRDLLDAAPSIVLENDAEELCGASDDAFDALLAALIARAVDLGLSDPPSRRQQQIAAEEGWIHLPLRRSLPFLAHNRSELDANATPALADALRRTGVPVGPDSYVDSLEHALLPTVDAADRKQIVNQFEGKGGSELKPKKAAKPKFWAARSSAALAANTFYPFLAAQRDLPLAGQSFSGAGGLEFTCPTGLKGTPPTLDFVKQSDNEVLAIESKLLEPFDPHEADFKPAYAKAMSGVHAAWRDEYERLMADAHRYRFLDAAQLVKHYLGVRKCFPESRVTLAYLYWEPTDAEDCMSCVVHRAEVEELRARVASGDVSFVARSYREIWEEWSAADQPRWLQDHVRALRARYEVAVHPKG